MLNTSNYVNVNFYVRTGAGRRVLTGQHGDPTGPIDVARVAQLADAQDGLEMRLLPARTAHRDQLLVHRYMHTTRANVIYTFYSELV